LWISIFVGFAFGGQGCEADASRREAKGNNKQERNKTIFMRHFPIKAPHTIVIFRALQLGDLLCTVPSFRALRAAFPLAHVTLVGLPWAEAFVRRFSRYLDDFIEFPGWPGLPEQEPQLARIPAFLKTVQGRRFDLALQMQGSGGITNPLVTLFGARQTAGYALPGAYRPDPKTFPDYPEGEHEVRIFLRLLQTLGIPGQGEQLEFPVTAAEQHSFEDFCIRHQLEPGGYVLLHPGARFSGRRWTPEKFASVGDRLAGLGYQVVITGTAGEAELTQKVVGAMRSPALDAAGQTDLGTLALLVKHARLLVSNDTGVSHLAAAVQAPSVILFTNSEPGRWRPLNRRLHRVVLNAYAASPKDVLSEAKLLLREEARVQAPV
jgi:ADP-heptose:LPS heptosyltransferase